MGQGFDLLQQAQLSHVGNNCLTGLSGGHAGVLVAVDDFGLTHGCTAAGEQLVACSLVSCAGHEAVVGEDADAGQVMALANLVVVGVMSGGDLNNAGALGHIGVLIADNGDLPVHQGQNDMAAMQVCIAGILCIDGDSGIAQHGLRTGGSQLQQLAGLLDGIQQMPEIACLLLVLNLSIGDGGVAVGAPVDHTVAAVDLAFLVQADKNFLNGVGAALVHGEALTLPVAGGAQLLQLLNDAVAIGIFPLPGTLQEAITADHFLGQAVGTHGLDNLRLGGDGCVVGAGQPQGLEALHTFGADQDVLHGVVNGVAHVQLAGDVGRRHHNGVRLLIFISLGMEVATFLPHFVDPGLNILRLIDLRQFSCHNYSLLV